MHMWVRKVTSVIFFLAVFLRSHPLIKEFRSLALELLPGHSLRGRTLRKRRGDTGGESAENSRLGSPSWKLPGRATGVTHLAVVIPAVVAVPAIATCCCTEQPDTSGKQHESRGHAEIVNHRTLGYAPGC